jgi:hypothetical protein
MLGRDADVASNSNSDGKLGFGFTKIDATGAALPDSAVTWSCVKDNVTGLIWEEKTAGNAATTYTNYDNTAAAQMWNGSAYVNPTQADIDATTNSVGFKNAVNSAGLCGASDWRLPTADELQSIVDYGVTNPTIDANWFPNTHGNVYWSSSPSAGVQSFAWIVNFYDGMGGGGSRRDYGVYVRLVRAGQ